MTRRRHSRSRLLRRVEFVLWVIAIVTLGGALWMEADAFLYQSLFADVFPQGVIVHNHVETARQRALHGTPIGRLTIPRLDLSVVVAEGTSDDVLRHAVGRVESSARPGESGNIVLAGHRDTFFRPLQDLRIGDLVNFESRAGKRTYKVSWIRVVGPEDLSVLEPKRESELTLVTCYPFRYIGSAPRRFIARAVAVDGDA